MRDADILVLGASGKVGGLLRAHWPAAGPRVLWQGRSRGAALGWVGWAPGMALPPVPVVVVLSGVTSGSGAELAENTAIGLDVARAAAKAGVGRVLLASTMAVYGATPERDATEDDPPLDPRPYGRAKLAMEAAMADALRGTATGLTALRIGNVAGADLLGIVVGRGERVRLDRFPDGQGPLRSYAGPGLLVRTIAGLARHPGPLPGVLNVAGKVPVAMADILDAAGLPFDWQPAGPAAVQRVAMDCRRLEALLPPGALEDDAATLAAEWRRG